MIIKILLIVVAVSWLVYIVKPDWWARMTGLWRQGFTWRQSNQPQVYVPVVRARDAFIANMVVAVVLKRGDDKFLLAKHQPAGKHAFMVAELHQSAVDPELTLPSIIFTAFTRRPFVRQLLPLGFNLNVEVGGARSINLLYVVEIGQLDEPLPAGYVLLPVNRDLHRVFIHEHRSMTNFWTYLL